MESPVDIQDLEIRLLLETMLHRYGYDFRNYTHASLKRRLLQCLAVCNITHISEAIPKIIHDRAFLDQLIYAMSVTVTECFRDPPFYRLLRERVIPLLATYPFINIWHAGCATGEEVYSMAILLQEEGLYNRVRIFATDINGKSLHQAKEGIYTIQNMEEYAQNYQESGGKASLPNYYHSKYDLARMHSSLKENIIFAAHNLATDNVFSETHLVMCRNVLIYFDQTLKNRALRLFDESLVHGGFLCLGTKESLSFSEISDRFTPVSQDLRIFQKKRGIR
ncbi:MAG: protein-glutamate O-methyltransferase CheR [Magnetococcales bacterium]|nr:protein-glutamate O-methyltransferase CheR [Magnetococcales bacterium]MBF0438275.1 protein-glutamate O-methyltransferase CheR [Magnetococcales bacterium]